jgi:hypothetical protein
VASGIAAKKEFKVTMRKILIIRARRTQSIEAFNWAGF